MGEYPLPVDLEEKEDGELDSEQEDENLNKASVSPNVHEAAIDKLLASCNGTSEDVHERISLNSLVSDRVSRKDKESSVSNRKRSNDANDERPSKVEKTIPSKDSRGASSASRQKSRRRKQKQRSRNDQREMIKPMERLSSMERKSKSLSVDVVAVDEELMERSRIEKEAAEKKELLNALLSKENEFSEFEKRREKLDEDSRKIDEMKLRLTKSERAVMMKKGYISDMCKRRDDYVARVKRLIEDIDSQIKEEGDMVRETEELRKEIDAEEVNWQKESNQLANDRLTTMLRVEKEVEDTSMIEVEEVVSDEREEDEALIAVAKDERETKTPLWMDDHDEETLRSMLLMQLLSKERSAEVESRPVELNEEGTPTGESAGEEMEQEETEMGEDRSAVTLPMGDGGDTGSTMCPWDLNGICKDDECPYVHDRSSSRLDYSQEIAT